VPSLHAVAATPRCSKVSYLIFGWSFVLGAAVGSLGMLYYALV
jgi:hypothetical protein